MTDRAPADWLAAQYLHERGLPHPNPPCTHDPADCPPLCTGHPAPPTELETRS